MSYLISQQLLELNSLPLGHDPAHVESGGFTRCCGDQLLPTLMSECQLEKHPATESKPKENLLLLRRRKRKERQRWKEEEEHFNFLLKQAKNPPFLHLHQIKRTDFWGYFAHSFHPIFRVGRHEAMLFQFSRPSLSVVLFLIFSTLFFSPIFVRSQLQFSDSEDADLCRGVASSSCPIRCFRADPVCGVDGITYWCGCPEAQCAGTRVAHLGACEVGNGGTGPQALLLLHIVWLIVLGFSLLFGLFWFCSNFHHSEASIFERGQIINWNFHEISRVSRTTRLWLFLYVRGRFIAIVFSLYLSFSVINTNSCDCGVPTN